MMWLGFAIPTLLFTLNGLHQFIPALPQFPVSYNLTQWLRERPWNGIFYTPLFISFAAIGFFYLLPTQILFSLWVFFVITRIQDIVGTSMGLRLGSMPLYPTRLYIGYQVAGAYCVLIGYFLWAGLPNFKRIITNALRFQPDDDRDELLPYRIAVWGLGACFAGTVLWCVWAGMSLWLALFVVSIYLFVVSLVMTRSVVEAGMPMTETSFRPIDLYAMFGQKAALGSRNLTLLAMFDAVFSRDMRGLTLSGMLDSAKIADGARFKRRSLLIVLPIAIVVAFAASAAIQLYLPYTVGANLMYSYAYRSNPLLGFTDLAAAAEGVRPSLSWVPPVSFGVGVAVTAFLAAMRTMFWWWPLHPLGYALAASWTMIVFWFPILIAWCIKVPLLKWNGVKGYRQFRPMFLGMIFGDCVDGRFVGDEGAVAAVPLVVTKGDVMSESFPENQWDALKARMESGGAASVIAFIEESDGEERIQLFNFAREGFAFRDWDGKNLDAMIVVCRAGINHMVSVDRIAAANALSYNLAADLAPCWEGDDLLRERRHYEAGAQAAEGCLEWREQLGKDALSFALAHWARGIHLLGLGRTANAAEAMSAAHERTVEAAKEKSEPTEIGVEATTMLLLSAGYARLAAWLAGTASAEADYRRILALLNEKGAVDAAVKDEVAFHIGQLEKTRRLFGE